LKIKKLQLPADLPNTKCQSVTLLTPVPLSNTLGTKRAMLVDRGSRDEAFVEITRRVRERVLELADGVHTHVMIPVQGSGTFALEATIGSMVPREGNLLVLHLPSSWLSLIGSEFHSHYTGVEIYRVIHVPYPYTGVFEPRVLHGYQSLLGN
jgi:hypothetical protein